jgi:hypothetical protein
MKERYLVSATTSGKNERAHVLMEVLTFLHSRNDVTLVKSSGDPPTSHAIAASEDAVDALRQAFGDRIVVELDSPLGLANC